MAQLSNYELLDLLMTSGRDSGEYFMNSHAIFSDDVVTTYVLVSNNSAWFKCHGSTLWGEQNG